MNQTTPVPVTLTLHDIEVLLAICLKQTALPGEAWMNTFASLRQQRDAFVKQAVAPPIPTEQPTAPTKRKGA